jgi:hypothetical protein
VRSIRKRFTALGYTNKKKTKGAQAWNTVFAASSYHSPLKYFLASSPNSPQQVFIFLHASSTHTKKEINLSDNYKHFMCKTHPKFSSESM